MVETIPTANQRAIVWWFLKLPWREKRKVPPERGMKPESETGVKSDTPFCSRLPIKKTNSASLPSIINMNVKKVCARRRLDGSRCFRFGLRIYNFFGLFPTAKI